MTQSWYESAIVAFCFSDALPRHTPRRQYTFRPGKGVSLCCRCVVVLVRAEYGYAERCLPAAGCSVSRRLPLIMCIGGLALWLVIAYGLRYGLMEDVQWVGICADDAQAWQCVVRSNLGLLIHFGVFGWGALLASVAGFFVPGVAGRVLAGAGLLLGLLALVLYTASLAVFAVVIAGLRWVRAG